MTDKRHGMVNYLAKCFCNDRLTAVKSSIVVNCDVPRLDVLNTANLCPTISVVGLFYLFTVMFTFVLTSRVWLDFTRIFRFVACVCLASNWFLYFLE